MKRTIYLSALVGASLLVAACTEQYTTPAVEEIPITTMSDEAMQLFKEGEHALDVGRFEDANDLFSEAVEKDPQFTYGYVNLMNAAQSAQEFIGSLTAAENSMGGASEGEQLLVQIARTQVDVDAGKRLELSTRLTELYPSSPRAWMNLSFVQGGMDMVEEARASATKALEIDPAFYQAVNGLGSSYMFNDPKDFAKAEELMRKCVELEPDEAPAHVALGDAFRAQNRLEDARDAYTRAAELDPTSALALSKKGHADTFLGDYAAARTDFQQASAVAEEQGKTTWARFGAYVSAYEGNAGAAVEELEAVFNSIDGMGLPADQVNGAKANTLSDIAVVAMYHGMFDAAQSATDRRAEILRAIADVVNDEDFSRSQEAGIAFWQGRLAAFRGDLDAARSGAEEHARLEEPETSPDKMDSYHVLMGIIELKAGNYQDAVTHFAEADPQGPFAKYHYGLALEGAGQTAEAMTRFNEVAAFNFNSSGYACVRGDAIAKG